MTRPTGPTAVRVIGPALASGDSKAFRVRSATGGAMPKDHFVN